MKFLIYNREKSVAYAHKWAFDRNPQYYDFSALGGDCTNFASQCLYAGADIMNYKGDPAWYYKSLEERSPSWTGVPFFADFLLRKEPTEGPFAILSTENYIRKGDFVQIRFEFGQERFTHTPIIISVGFPPKLDNILVAAHSNDVDNRPLSTYENVAELRFLHVLGAWK